MVKEPLLSLTPTELRNLAAAVESGRLCPPYSPLGLQRFVSHTVATEIAASLNELSEFGSAPSATARTLFLLANALDDRPRLEDVIRVVTTGPNGVGAAYRDTSVVVAELFRKAENSVIVAGYAVHQGQRVFKELADRMAEDPQLLVRLYLDIQRNSSNSSAPEEIVRRFSYRFRSSQWPQERPFPEIYYDPRSVTLDQGKCAALHAKCVVVDRRHVFISSANFTEAAQERNIEVQKGWTSVLPVAWTIHHLDNPRSTAPPDLH